MNKTTSLLIRIVISLILIQTLRFKFLAHPDSVSIFTKVGLEPFGRIGIGVLELIAALLLLIPKTIWLGALLTTALILGAVFSHITQLGIEVKRWWKLFSMALGVLILGLFILWEHRKKIPIISNIETTIKTSNATFTFIIETT